MALIITKMKSYRWNQLDRKKVGGRNGKKVKNVSAFLFESQKEK